ncbi:MAG: hypothetical protein K2P27_07205 [Lachnospiraceae bacterium]|nr:hypothetical protein [Lachnospiraceae bacterium]
MKNTRLWIADSDASYADAFREYVNLKKSYLFQVRMCTRKEQLREALSEEEIEILLISATWYEDLKDSIRNECVILLSEGGLPKELHRYPAVYKYQSVENILREIMYYYSDQEEEEEYCTGVLKDNKVIGVYAPSGGIRKNKFAITLGQILAEERNVLYLNLEECSGLSELMGGNHWNLSDLIYYLRQKKSSFLYRLNSMVQKLDRMDYIPSCESYTDFVQITTEEWQRLLYLIRTQSTYDVLILDLGILAGHSVDLLRQLTGLYVPAEQDLISQGRFRQWQRYMQVSDAMDVLEKVQRLELPGSPEGPCGEEDLFMLPQQELGCYIRGLLQE